MLSTTVSTERVLDRRRGEKRTNREVVVIGSVANETTNYTKMTHSDPMYVVGLIQFTEALSKAQLRALRDKGENVLRVTANVENGRKFDKIVLVVTEKVRKPEGGFTEKLRNMDAKYFVDRKDGAIYGVKSPVAPNLNHYYGTVQTVDKWNWEGETAKPISEEEAGVEASGGYGDFIHYRPVTKAKATV